MTIREWLENAEDFVLSVIEERRRDKWATATRVALSGLSTLFSGIVQGRLTLYRHSFLRPHTLGCQVISIGNLTVGGTGKTPIVEVFARHLQKSGRRVAILSRGYKRKEKPLLIRLKNKFTGGESAQPRVVSNGERLLLDSAQSGDEPYMLATNLPDVVVVVDKDRVKAGRHAVKKFGCDTLVLDDGFQYLRLRHRLDIVLVDFTNPFGNRRLLPRGILREPVRNIRRAGFIFITKSPPEGAPELKAQLRQLNPIAEIAECRHYPKYLQDAYTGERTPLDLLKGKNIAAVSGIASPKGFEQSLINHGGILRYHKRYADHHRYRQQEIIDVINRAAERSCEMIVTTEKDAVRFPMIERRDLPIYFLRVEIEMISGEEKFHDWIDRICFK